MLEKNSVSLVKQKRLEERGLLPLVACISSLFPALEVESSIGESGSSLHIDPSVASSD